MNATSNTVGTAAENIHLNVKISANGIQLKKSKPQSLVQSKTKNSTLEEEKTLPAT